MRIRKILAISAAFTMILSFPACAYDWFANGFHIWGYGDGTYAVSTWIKDGDRDYYFGPNGWLYENTVTPDGWYVGQYGLWDKSVPQQAPPAEVPLNTAWAQAALNVHKYYTNIPQDGIAKAEEIAQGIAHRILNDAMLKTDIQRIQMAADYVKVYCDQGTYGNDAAKYYRSPYGVFVTGNYTCAGATRALGRVLDYMGYEWQNANESQWTHQWVIVNMDGQIGYADGQIGQADYGEHFYNSLVSQ